jgi:RNA recognition motif-containing protein
MTEHVNDAVKFMSETFADYDDNLGRLKRNELKSHGDILELRKQISTLTLLVESLKKSETKDNLEMFKNNNNNNINNNNNQTQNTNKEKKILFVGNLPKNCSESSLYNFFNEFGLIKNTFINNNRRFAFIQFENNDGITMAISKMNGFIFNKKLLICEISKLQVIPDVQNNTYKHTNIKRMNIKGTNIKSTNFIVSRPQKTRQKKSIQSQKGMAINSTSQKKDVNIKRISHHIQHISKTTANLPFHSKIRQMPAQHQWHPTMVNYNHQYPNVKLYRPYSNALQQHQRPEIHQNHNVHQNQYQEIHRDQNIHQNRCQEIHQNQNGRVLSPSYQIVNQIYSVRHQQPVHQGYMMNFNNHPPNYSPRMNYQDQQHFMMNPNY